MPQDALVEYPFALPAPARLDGREAIRKYFAAVARMPLELRARDITMHQTSDPEVIVAEWDYDGLETDDGPFVPSLEHPGFHGPQRPDRSLTRLPQPPGAGRGARPAPQSSSQRSPARSRTQQASR